MTVFQLMVYSCIFVVHMPDAAVDAACQWDERGLYRTIEKCDEAGAAALMGQAFVTAGTAIERHVCAPTEVE